MAQLEQIKAKSDAVSGKINSDRQNVNQARSRIQKAFKLKNDLSRANSRLPSYEKIEANINKVKNAAARLSSESGKLSIEVGSLRKAFPDISIRGCRV